MTTPRDVSHVDQLAQEIRNLVHHAQAAGYAPPEIAAALVYELAAAIGGARAGMAQTDALIDDYAATMKKQIRTFRALSEHP